MNKGFTLIELLVVVLIVGILSAVALPQYTTAVEKSRAAEALTLMSAIAGSAERYKMQKDDWPDSFSKLDIEVPTIKGSPNEYGGKHFKVKMGQAGSSFVIVATRNLNSAPYSLKTILFEYNNGTVEAQRVCTSSSGIDTTYTLSGEAQKICDAITGGGLKNENF